MGEGFTGKGRNSLEREEDGGYFREWEEMFGQRGMFGDQRGSVWLKFGT